MTLTATRCVHLCTVYVCVACTAVMDHVSCCQATGMEGLVTTLRDPRYMEHDAYLMLDQIMRRLYHLCVERFPPSHCCGACCNLAWLTPLHAGTRHLKRCGDAAVKTRTRWPL